VKRAFLDLLLAAQRAQRLDRQMLTAASRLADSIASLYPPYHRIAIGPAIYRVETLAWPLNAPHASHAPLVSSGTTAVLLRNGVALHDRRTPEIIDEQSFCPVRSGGYIRYPGNPVAFATAQEILHFIREAPALLEHARAHLDTLNEQTYAALQSLSSDLRAFVQTHAPHTGTHAASA
jgi:hypothetical protein